jgi:hypothetical protein
MKHVIMALAVAMLLAGLTGTASAASVKSTQAVMGKVVEARGYGRGYGYGGSRRYYGPGYGGSRARGYGPYRYRNYRDTRGYRGGYRR